MIEQIFSAIAMVLTFVAFLPYIRSIRRGETRPHVFSWIIWGLTTTIACLAQLADGAGTGAWSVGVSGIITFYIAGLAYAQRSDTHITKSDWVFLLAALGSLPCWFLTADPLWAVVILTIVDVLGFGPTLRRAVSHPHEEHLTFFTLYAIRNLLVIFALENFSVTTVLFPAVVGIACLALVVLVALRRRVVQVGSNKTS